LGILRETVEFDQLPELETVRQAVERRLGVAVRLEAPQANTGTLVTGATEQASGLQVTRRRLYKYAEMLAAENLEAAELAPTTGEPGAIDLQTDMEAEPTLMHYTVLALVDLDGRPRSSLTELKTEPVGEEDDAPLLEAELQHRLEKFRRQLRLALWLGIPLFLLSFSVLAFWLLIAAAVVLLTLPFVWLGMVVRGWLRGSPVPDVRNSGRGRSLAQS
jgi:hypothetical protein